MKTIIFALTLALIALHSSASQPDEISFSDFVGTWRTKQVNDSGNVISGYTEIKEDQTFKAIVAVDGDIRWQVEGEVTLQGTQLTWNYLKSNIDLPPDSTDTDIIISVDSESFTYRSGLTDEINSYQRVD